MVKIYVCLLELSAAITNIKINN